MASSILFTQCLQNDFVKPIGRFEPLPNRWHVGYSESLRLMGENPAEGPVSRIMRWASEQTDELLKIVHIRKWYDPRDSFVQELFANFGEHCVQDSPGAEFAFGSEGGLRSNDLIVNSSSLNDFQNTCLLDSLIPLAGKGLRVGIIGVWTDAKVNYLAYELVTRFPTFEISVCSALTASSSRHSHYNGLEKIRRNLGIKVIESLGAFVEFLGGGPEDPWQLNVVSSRLPDMKFEDFDPATMDKRLVRFLFRDCQLVRLQEISGGYANDSVAVATIEDQNGSNQVPQVVKIGDQLRIGNERGAFEQIQDLLGPSAPQIGDFADYGGRGAIRYRYAALGGGFSENIQDAYQNGIQLSEFKSILDSIFGEQLMQLYKLASLESCDLLAHYEFDEDWTSQVRANVEAIVGQSLNGDSIELMSGISTPNICLFYEDTLKRLPKRSADRVFQSWVHGDLNGRNVILDHHRNAWLIDYSHSQRGHVLKDLLKFENDLLYIWTPIQNDQDVRLAFKFSDRLFHVDDLAAPLPAPDPDWPSNIVRAWEVIRHLRSFYPDLVHSGRSPFQIWVPQLRYAVHNLGFAESTHLQRKWALYSAGRLSRLIADYLTVSSKLRVDWLPDAWASPGRIGLTILPGRKDWGRNLASDLQSLKEDGVHRVICLVPGEELRRYGVGDLLPAMRKAGLEAFHLPIVDQKACSRHDMESALTWIDDAVDQGKGVLIHCVGGLGRSGMVAAAYLRVRGANADQAIETVRKARSQRALETAAQEEFIRHFDPAST